MTLDNFIMESRLFESNQDRLDHCQNACISRRKRQMMLRKLKNYWCVQKSNYWCFTVQKARDTLNYCCCSELRQIIAANDSELLMWNYYLLYCLKDM
jgi:hypothetical protein